MTVIMDAQLTHGQVFSFVADSIDDLRRVVRPFGGASSSFSGYFVEGIGPSRFVNVFIMEEQSGSGWLCCIVLSCAIKEIKNKNP